MYMFQDLCVKETANYNSEKKDGVGVFFPVKKVFFTRKLTKNYHLALTAAH